MRTLTRSRHGLRTVGNVLWFVFAGFWLALAYVIAGIVVCVTIIGIPFGVQSFKLAAYALWPFGKTVVSERSVGDREVWMRSPQPIGR